MNTKIFLILILFAFVSCDKYDEVHTEYVDTMDEQKYSVIPENVILHSGFERLFVSADIIYTSSLDKFVVEIDGESQTFDIPTPVSDTSKIMQELPGLAEGVEDVYLYTTDNENNKSIIKLYTGRVLGQRYRSEIQNRNVLATEDLDEGFKIKFNSAPENAVWVNFAYTTSADTDTTIRIPSESSEVLISNYKLGSSYSYATFYLPDVNSIDTISTAVQVTGDFPTLDNEEVVEE